MVIDAHHHLWQYNQDKHQWIDATMSKIRRDFTGNDLATLAAKNRIDGTVLVQVDQTEEETLWLLEQAQRYPIIKGVVGWVDFRAHNVKERLAYFSSFEKLKGFRHIAQSEPNDFLIDPAFQKGVSYLHPYGLTYDILIYHYQLASAIQLVRSNPDQQFVVDHLAKPDIKGGLFESWTSDMRALGKFPNVCCKLSGLITEADHHEWSYQQLVPYMELVLETFGVERLMFGSDWPVCLLAGEYGQVLDIADNFISELSDYQRSLIMYKNAKEFYNL